MVLYHASTMYHLLYCIVHKLTFNDDKDCDLLLVEYIKPLKERNTFLKKLNTYGFFRNIRYVPEQQFKLKKGIALDENSSEKDIKIVINNISSAFERWFGCDIKRYSELYIASDQHSCGIYLINNGISYTYMEDASGMLSEQNRFLSITRSNNLTNYIINEHLGCAGRNKYVKAKLCDLKHQQKGFCDKKAVDFSIYDALKNIIPNKVPVLLEFFGNIKTVIKSDKKICLFLTQDLNTLKIKNLDLQELTATTLVDYFCPNHKLIIKPHPKDRWQNYKRIFPRGEILEKSVPSELLPFAIEGEIHTVLTASSTSIRGFSEFAEKAYSFTTEIETHRERLDPMFALTQVLKQIGVKKGVNVTNINEKQMINFLDNAGIKSDGKEVLIDGGTVDKKTTDSKDCRILFCLNPCYTQSREEHFDFKDKFVIKAHFTPESNSLFEEKEDIILAYSNDSMMSEKLSEINMKIKLYNSKAEVEINCEKIVTSM
ncbi:MAG: glycosyltransferase family 52 [Ruminococcus sp.]